MSGSQDHLISQTGAVTASNSIGDANGLLLVIAHRTASANCRATIVSSKAGLSETCLMCIAGILL